MAPRRPPKYGQQGETRIDPEGTGAGLPRVVLFMHLPEHILCLNWKRKGKKKEGRREGGRESSSTCPRGCYSGGDTWPGLGSSGPGQWRERAVTAGRAGGVRGPSWKAGWLREAWRLLSYSPEVCTGSVWINDPFMPCDKNPHISHDGLWKKVGCLATLVGALFRKHCFR